MSPQRLQFPSQDGLTITADDYHIENSKAYILLCHRSHFNRGEYREIAPKLNESGYSCLAIDQRSGMKILGTTNETYALAKHKGLPTGYVAAKPDIEAAIKYLYAKNQAQPIILFGSSYSAALALVIAAHEDKIVKAVIAFSPGEYLKNINVAETIATIKIPTFITSAKAEIPDTSRLVNHINPKYLTQYKPTDKGAHGARALWAATEGNRLYWRALTIFLTTLA